MSISDKEFLKKVQADRPMHQSRLKKDILTLAECIYCFYNVEPFDENEKMQLNITYPFQEEGFIRSFDVERVLDILKSSELFILYQNAIPTKKFINFLEEKEISLPMHFRSTQQENQAIVEEGKLREIEKLLDVDLMLLTIPQIKKLHVRVTAAYFFKKSNNSKMSAAKLATDKTFQGAVSYTDHEVKDPKKFSENFSDLSVRSPKRKKSAQKHPQK